MPEKSRSPFSYAVIRVVPHVERGECLNVGIVLYCRARRFLGARLELGELRGAALAALAPDCDPAAVRAELAGLRRIAAGEPGGGPIARLAAAERFTWLVAPSSTIVQPSEVHTGLTDDPAATLDRLYATLVELPG